MDMRPKSSEKKLVQKLPMQWRSLLSVLLNESAKPNLVMSMVAMRYRQLREAQSAESWDQLLSALCRKVPVVGTNDELSFQYLLWCFPDIFIQRLLTFLLQFQDTVSADSLDRFFNSALAETQSPLQKELTSVLAIRNGACSDASAGKSRIPKERSDDDDADHDTNDMVLMAAQSSNENHIRKSGSKTVNRSYAKDQSSKADFATCSPIPTKHIEPAEFGDKVPTINPHSDQFVKMNITETRKKASEEKFLSSNSCVNGNDIVIILDSDEENEEEEVGIGEKMEVAKDQPLSYDLSHDQGTANEEVRTSETSCCVEEVDKCCLAEAEDRAAIAINNTECLSYVQKLHEVLLSGDADSASLELDFLLNIPPSQVSTIFSAIQWERAGDGQLCSLVQRLAAMSERLSHVTSSALVNSIIQSKYERLEETPSRQVMSYLTDLAQAFPQQVVSSVCCLLQESPCNGAQSEVVSALCKGWESDTLTSFLRKLCLSDAELDENLLSVVNSAIGKHPDLHANTLTSVLRLLETGAAHLAKNARYGRLVVNLVKSYKNQINSSHVPVLQSIAYVHTSVIRKSLRSLVDSLPT